jgi:hypothetical protein
MWPSMLELPLGLLCASKLALISDKFISGRVVTCTDLPSLHTHYLLAYHWKYVYHDQVAHWNFGTLNRRIECFDVSLYVCITSNHKLHGTCFVKFSRSLHLLKSLFPSSLGCNINTME